MVSKMPRRSQQPPAQNFRQEPEAQVGLNVTVKHFSVEIAKGALADHFPGLAAKHRTPKKQFTLHGH